MLEGFDKVQAVLKDCQSWSDVARLCKASLNPRTISVVGIPQSVPNAVLRDEVIAFLDSCGFDYSTASRVADCLVALGFLRDHGSKLLDPPGSGVADVWSFEI